MKVTHGAEKLHWRWENASFVANGTNYRKFVDPDLELRTIRDNADRKVRRMSLALNEAFIVEESMLVWVLVLKT